MSLNKRAPVTFPDDGSNPALFNQFAAISKAGWAELYCDLYRQTHGDDATADTVMADAYSRAGTLRAQGLLTR